MRAPRRQLLRGVVVHGLGVRAVVLVDDDAGRAGRRAGPPGRVGGGERVLDQRAGVGQRQAVAVVVEGVRVARPARDGVRWDCEGL